jgi:chaperonin cofactor prefoldin
MTQMEVSKKIPFVTERSITPRFAELKKQGVVKEVGQRPCRITGRITYIWDVTSKLPEKIEKIDRPTRAELEEQLSEYKMALEEISDRTNDNWAAARADRALGRERQVVMLKEPE